MDKRCKMARDSEKGDGVVSKGSCLEKVLKKYT